MDWMHLTDSRVRWRFFIKTMMNITENNYQYFEKDCCINISIIKVVVIFREHGK
jgi:hypothetical protein